MLSRALSRECDVCMRWGSAPAAAHAVCRSGPLWEQRCSIRRVARRRRAVPSARPSPGACREHRSVRSELRDSTGTPACLARRRFMGVPSPARRAATEVEARARAVSTRRDRLGALPLGARRLVAAEPSPPKWLRLPMISHCRGPIRGSDQPPREAARLASTRCEGYRWAPKSAGGPQRGSSRNGVVHVKELSEECVPA
jgi:hypothetical protein